MGEKLERRRRVTALREAFAAGVPLMEVLGRFHLTAAKARRLLGSAVGQKIRKEERELHQYQRGLILERHEAPANSLLAAQMMNPESTREQVHFAKNLLSRASGESAEGDGEEREVVPVISVEEARAACRAGGEAFEKEATERFSS